jgi:hypothetical protein
MQAKFYFILPWKFYLYNDENKTVYRSGWTLSCMRAKFFFPHFACESHSHCLAHQTSQITADLLNTVLFKYQ